MPPSSETDPNEPKQAKPCWLARILGRSRDSKRETTYGLNAQSALDASAANAELAVKHGSQYRAGITLAEMKPGECGIVRRLFGPARGRLRLLEMGLTPGTHVQVVRAAAFGGPLDISVRNYQLSLRLQEAAGVWLDDEDNANDAATELGAAHTATSDAGVI